MNLHKEMGANKKNIMEINPNIYKEAYEIVDKRNKLQEYINVCIEAKICPECGKGNLQCDMDVTGSGDYKCSYCNWEIYI